MIIIYYAYILNIHGCRFLEKFPKWTDDFIINWLMENTTFNHIINLGKDEDNIPPFQEYYSRTLFACFR